MQLTGRDEQLIAMNICGFPEGGIIGKSPTQAPVSIYSRLNSCDLTLCLSRLLELGHLLTLDRRRCDFLTKNDITNFASCEGCDVHAIPLAKVLKNRVAFRKKNSE